LFRSNIHVLGICPHTDADKDTNVRNMSLQLDLLIKGGLHAVMKTWVKIGGHNISICQRVTYSIHRLMTTQQFTSLNIIKFETK